MPPALRPLRNRKLRRLPQARRKRKPAALTPSKSGYADVNGIKLYHEIYGQGEPLVLCQAGS